MQESRIFLIFCSDRSSTVIAYIQQKGGGARIMISRSRKKSVRSYKSNQEEKKSAREAGPKSVMVAIRITSEERLLLDEIRFHIGKNSHGNFPPSRTVIIRRLIGRLRGAKKALKQALTPEDLDKVIDIYAETNLRVLVEHSTAAK